MPQSDIRVAICITTFQRHDLLGELLDGIAHLKFLKMPTPQVEIVVVDNDVLASAKQACSKACLPWPVKYVLEPRRGVTYVRNRAIAEVGSVDFIAFIDDDEIPSVHWLDELLWTQAEFSADVACGPVLPRFAPNVATWVRGGGFFDPPVPATGTARRTCATNNVLIGAWVFKDVPRFDDAFALSGAEDTDFFLRVVHAGYRIVWSKEAAVSESISAERGTLSWILRREYQTGNGWVFCEANMESGLRTWLVRFSKAWGHVALGSAKTVASSFLLDWGAVVHALQRVSLGAGMLAALMGHRFLAYRHAGFPWRSNHDPAR